MSHKLLTISFVAAALLASVTTHADDKYYQIKSVTVQDVTAQYPAVDAAIFDNGLASCKPEQINSNAPSDVLGDIDAAGVIIDQIMNLGRKVWNIIALGKPVTNINFDVANALPKGVTCWRDLQNWSAPQSKVYAIQYKNGFGMNVIDFAFRVTFVPGGNYKGQGKYIANATVQPAHLTVQWGFNFDAAAEVPLVFNQGTSEDPIAALQLNIHWKTNTVVTHAEQTETFYLNGAGVFQKMP